jgi:hypothetical protein
LPGDGRVDELAGRIPAHPRGGCIAAQRRPARARRRGLEGSEGNGSPSA